MAHVRIRFRMWLQTQCWYPGTVRTCRKATVERKTYKDTISTTELTGKLMASYATAGFQATNLVVRFKR